MESFDTWNGLEQLCIAETGCKPFSGVGICYRPKEKTTILRSVDGTFFYDDKFGETIEYTLFGHDGDQQESEPKFNEPLLNPEKTEHIYLYRVTNGTNGKNKRWIWYGKCEIVGKLEKLHHGKNGSMRKIILLKLKIF
jgi:hypothetical protein